MKQALTLSITIYFLLGNLLLPLGDFSVMPDLPAMYTKCKTTEHADMNPLDFITDHLLNIDGMFDDHDNGDEQKPHKPFMVGHQFHVPIYVSLAVSVEVTTPFVTQRIQHPARTTHYHFLDVNDIFKPPIS